MNNQLRNRFKPLLQTPIGILVLIGYVGSCIISIMALLLIWTIGAVISFIHVFYDIQPFMEKHRWKIAKWTDKWTRIPERFLNKVL